MIVGVGSTNLFKHDAVAWALYVESPVAYDFNIICLDAPSGQNAQPIGLDETLGGAENRSTYTLEKIPEATIAFGIENGVIRLKEEPLTYIDIAFVVVKTRDGQTGISNSSGVVFPREYVDEAMHRGFERTTVGQIITEKLKGEPQDPHETLTSGRARRKSLLGNAVLTALRQIDLERYFHPEFVQSKALS